MVESFPFKKRPGISQKQMRAFAEMEFVAKAENIVFSGPTGVGKTASNDASKTEAKPYRIQARGQFSEVLDRVAFQGERVVFAASVTTTSTASCASAFDRALGGGFLQPE